MKSQFKTGLAFLFAGALLVQLSGCLDSGSSSSNTSNGTENGAGDGGNDDPNKLSTLSGTAAAGAPLVGFVAARGSGEEELVWSRLNADGSFELNLDSLQGPYLIYASGLAGGRAYTLLSAATDEDAGDGSATLNVTPMTDLVVGAATGKNPQAFFNDPDFTQLTAEALEFNEERLRGRIQPVMTAYLDDEAAAFDLRLSPFSADRSGFDAVLDLLEVTLDGETARLRNRAEGTEITEDLAAAAESVAFPDPDPQKAANWQQISASVAASLKNFKEIVDQRPLTEEEADRFLHPDLKLTYENVHNFDQAKALAVSDNPGFREALSREVNLWQNFLLVEVEEVDANTTRVSLDFGDVVPQWQWQKEEGDPEWRLLGSGKEWGAFFSTNFVRFVGDYEGSRTELEMEAYLDPHPTQSFTTGDRAVLLALQKDDDAEGGYSWIGDEDMRWIVRESDPDESFELTSSQLDRMYAGQYFRFRVLNAANEDKVDSQLVRLLTVPPHAEEAGLELPEFIRPSLQELRNLVTDGGEVEVEWTLPKGYRALEMQAFRYAAPSGACQVRCLENGKSQDTLPDGISLLDEQTSGTFNFRAANEGGDALDSPREIELRLEVQDVFGRNVFISFIGR